QAFVLVASGRPLPPYAEWSGKLGELPWKAVSAEDVWRYDGRSFDRDTRRGEVRPLADLPPPLETACRALQARPGIEAIPALAFPVQPQPKAGPAGPAGTGNARRTLPGEAGDGPAAARWTMKSWACQAGFDSVSRGERGASAPCPVREDR